MAKLRESHAPDKQTRFGQEASIAGSRFAAYSAVYDGDARSRKHPCRAPTHGTKCQRVVFRPWFC